MKRNHPLSETPGRPGAARLDTREAAAVLQVSELRLDARTRSVTRGERQIALSLQEFAVLELLMRRTAEVVTTAELSEAVWEEQFDQFSNVVDATIQRLAAKVDFDAPPQLLHTVRGQGYTLRPD